MPAAEFWALTPVEWTAHYDAWSQLQRNRDQLLDFHVSRVCAFIRNCSGKVWDKLIDARELMTSPLQGQAQIAGSEDPVKASLHLMSLWDAVAPHLK